MAFPTGWPPRRPRSSRRSLRFYVTDTATANFADKAYLFIDDTDANPYTPLPYVAPGSSTPVELGSQPLGTGEAPEDANLSQTDPVKQALPKAAVWSSNIRISNDGVADLEFSFDGTNVHGRVKMNETVVYRDRIESGIAVRGAGAVYRIEAW